VGWQEGHNVKRASGFFNVDSRRPGEMWHRRFTFASTATHATRSPLRRRQRGTITTTGPASDSKLWLGRLGFLLHLVRANRFAARVESARNPGTPSCQISPCNWTEIRGRGMHVQRLFCTIGSTQTLGTAISASISPRSIVELMITWEIRSMSVLIDD
jgi:hypothetical protein